MRSPERPNTVSTRIPTDIEELTNALKILQVKEQSMVEEIKCIRRKQDRIRADIFALEFDLKLGDMVEYIPSRRNWSTFLIRTARGKIYKLDAAWVYIKPDDGSENLKRMYKNVTKVQ